MAFTSKDEVCNSGNSTHLIPKRGKEPAQQMKKLRGFFGKSADKRLEWKIPFFKASNGFLPLFSKEQMSMTPSYRHGMSCNEEKILRQESVEAIFIVGEKCRLPFTTMATACVYFHRFFMQQSMRVHNACEVGISMLFLASKSESTRIKLYDLTRIYFDTKLNNKEKYLLQTTLEECLACYRLQDKELLGSQVTKFDFQVDLPHDWLLPITIFFIKYYTNNHDNNSNSNSNSNSNDGGNAYKDWKQYCQLAFKFVNISLRSIIIVAFPPQWIAIACMEIAIRYFENNTFKKYKICRNWFEIFDSSLTESTLNAMICEILTVWTNRQIQNINAKEIANQEAKKTILSRIRTNGCAMSQDLAKYLPKSRMSRHFENTKQFSLNVIDWTLYPLPKELDNITNKNFIKHLLSNKQAISPMTLAPHKYLLRFQLKPQCYTIIDPQTIAPSSSYNSRSKSTNKVTSKITSKITSKRDKQDKESNNETISDDVQLLHNSKRKNDVNLSSLEQAHTDDDSTMLPPSKKRKRKSRWDQH